MSERAEVVVLLCAVAGVAYGHAGDDHGPARPNDSPFDGVRAVGATGDLYEVLVKYEPTAVGEPTRFRIFVADAVTNEPIAGAEVRLTLAGDRGEIALAPVATDTPGAYAADHTFAAAGDFDAIAEVTRAGEVDLLVLGAVRGGLPEAMLALREHSHLMEWVLGGIAFVVLFLVGMWVVAWLQQRRTSRAVPSDA